MKIFRILIAFFTLGLAITACQKDLSFEAGNAKGNIVKDANGDCTGFNVTGNYFVDTVLTNASYVDVQIDITKIGTYLIKSDTVNGYSFTALGSTGVLGINPIRLVASGKPLAAGVNTFTIVFDGNFCSFDVLVIPGSGGGGGTQAVYTFGGAPTTCTGTTLAGTYTAGIAMTSANTATINNVAVTTAGAYNITTSVNGVTFSGVGNLTTTSTSIVLTASGTTPTSATPITSTFPINSGTSTCSFDVTFAATPPPATFTMNCAGATFSTTFQVGTTIPAGTTITIPITGATNGSYNVANSTVNGITISGSGAVSPTSTSITLNVSGTPSPAATPNTTFPITAGGSSCSVVVPVSAAPAPATFTMNCAGATFSTTFQVGTAIPAGTTITIPITGATNGSYNVAAGTVNAITVSGSGTVTTASTSITLNVSGTPTAAATPNTTFPINVGGGSCNVVVPVSAAPPPATSFIRCTINGVVKNFNFDGGSANGTANAFYFLGNNDLTMFGEVVANGNETISMNVTKSNGNVTTGNYQNTLAASVGGFYMLNFNYDDAAGNPWSIRSILNPTPDNFVLNITTLNATRVIGTFSGTLRDNNGNGTNTMPVTAGSFDLPIE
jgi:hypothetical protein